MNLGFQYSQSREVVIGTKLESVSEYIALSGRALLEKENQF